MSHSTETDQSSILFTPSSKRPSLAFVKERVDIASDNSNWLIRKMNLDYANSIKNEKTSVSPSDDESECLTNQPDTVSFSTDLAPYMDSSAETLASTNASDCEDSVSSESRLGDITVITISSDEEDNMVKDNQSIIECILKDTSNSLNSDENVAKPTRKKSFTLECPSPSLVNALQENRIGLEPTRDQKRNSTSTVPSENVSQTKAVSNTSIPKARVPVSRSLMFSLAEKRDFEGTVVNPDEEKFKPDEEIKRLSNKRNITETPIPVLDISKLCKGAESFFGQPSFCNSVNSTYFVDRSKADCTKPPIELDNDECDNKSAADSTYTLNPTSTTGNEESENLEKSSSEEVSFNPESNRTINCLLQKQRNLRQFIDDFNQNEELSNAALPTQEDSVANHSRQISVLESQLAIQQDEIID